MISKLYRWLRLGKNTDKMFPRNEIIVDRLEQVMDFEDILEQSDLTEHEVILILFNMGYLKIPPYLEEFEEDYEEAPAHA